MIETPDGSAGLAEDHGAEGAGAHADSRAGRPQGPRLRIALAHDWLCGYRGGEAVLERLVRLVSSEHQIAALYVMFDDGRPLSAALDGLRTEGPDRVVASWLNRLPGGSGRLRRWLLPMFPRAVAELSGRLATEHARQPIDLVISTSSAAIKGLRPPTGVPHLCYCHAPARYVWSRGEDYAGGLRGLGLRAFGTRFRAWDARTASHVSRFIANSTHTASEVRRCYGRDAVVVHPPVRTEFYTPGPGRERSAFWLVVSALEPYKRVDLAIEAANRADVELVIAGAGSQRARLEAIARGGRVRFMGRVSDVELRELYRTARLLVFPQVEDFGIAAAEALACGLPVVARRAGGAMDIVEDGVAGSLFDQPEADSVLESALRTPDPGPCAAACRELALRFSEARFDEAMRAQIAAQVCAASEADHLVSS